METHQGNLSPLENMGLTTVIAGGEILLAKVGGIYLQKGIDKWKSRNAEVESVFSKNNGRMFGGVDLDSSTRLDYSSSFADDLVNFKPGSQHFSGSLDDDLILVQFHRSDRALGEGRSAAWWTTPEQGNVFQTIDDVRQNLALPSSWGPRDAVSIAKVPKGSEVDFFKGLAASQRANGVIFEGNALQFRFKDFDESWILDTRKIPGIGNE